jgi:hypothetical protein
MKIIVLIACVSKKGDKKAKAKDLYISPLFNNSLAYAYSLNPDKIFILSALHHLLDLEKEIEPYNVTLSNVPKKKRKVGLKVLNSQEKKEWGEKVIEMLANQTDLKQDRFIILAGQEYIKPIRHRLTYYENPLEGVSLFDRIRVLKEMLNSKYF